MPQQNKRYETFDEIKHVAMKHYSDNNFCAVASLTVVCQVPYGKAFNTLKKLGRRKGNGTYTHQTLQAVNALNCRFEEVRIPCTTINQAEKYFKGIRGNYLVNVRGHMLSIRDGVIMDWTAGKTSRRRVLNVWKIEKYIRERKVV